MLGNTYFRVSERLGGDIYVYYNIEKGGSPISLMYKADRAWREEGGKVFYLKNREADISSAIVDLMEFAEIKLSARPYNYNL